MSGIRLLFLFLLLVPAYQVMHAQQDKWHLGLISGIAGKFRLWSGEGPLFQPWGNLSLHVQGIYEGQDAASPDFSIKTGIALDATQYRQQAGFVWGTDQLKWSVHPEILFPLGTERIFLCAGFGIDYLITTRLYINGSSNTVIMDNYYYGNLEYKERPVVPFGTLGLLYHFTEKVRLSIQLRQNLVSAYLSNEQMNFGSGVSSANWQLVHKPAYMQFGLGYMFF
jgi:hypothetical protein